MGLRSGILRGVTEAVSCDQRECQREDAEVAGFGHEGASHHFERDSVTGLILSVKRDLSTGKVRRIRGRGVKLDYWHF